MPFCLCKSRFPSEYGTAPVHYPSALSRILLQRKKNGSEEPFKGMH